MQGAVISLTALIEQLGVMGLSEYEERVANYCIDEGLEIVPLKELTKHLRDAGMPAVRALAVKNALAPSPPLREAAAAPKTQREAAAAAPTSFSKAPMVCLFGRLVNAVVFE